MPTLFDIVSSDKKLVDQSGSLYDAVAKPRPYQSLYDATLGSASYGGADALGLLSKNAGEITGIDYFKQLTDQMDSFKRSHPEYAPTEVDSALDLLTNPKAIISHVSAGLPYMIATVGAMSGLPALGVGAVASAALAGGLIYGIESERGYQKALSDGATEQEATASARIGGAVNTGLQLLLGKGMISFAEGGESSFISKAVGDASTLARGIGATGDAFGFLAKQGIIGAAQGSTTDLVETGVFGKKIDWKQFFDQRGQDAIGAAAMAGVFGGGMRLLKGGAPVEGVDADSPQKDVDVFNQSSLRDMLVKQGYPSEHANVMSRVVDSLANNWARANDSSKEVYYANHGVEEAFAENQPSGGKKLAQQGEVKTQGSTDEQTNLPSSSQVMMKVGSDVLDGYNEIAKDNKEPANVKPVQENERNILKDGRQLRATVTTSEDEGGRFIVKAIKLHDDSTGSYEQAVVPEEEFQNYRTSAEARAAIFDHLSTKYPLPKQLVEQASNSDVGEGLKPVPKPAPEVSELIKPLAKVLLLDLSPEQQTAIYKTYGGADSPDAVDNLSRGLAAYLKRGEAPSSELINSFKTIKDGLASTYKGVRWAMKLPTAVQATFDNLFFEDSSSVAAKRIELDGLQARLDKLGNMKASSDEGQFKTTVQQNIESTQQDYDDTRRSLKNLKEAQFTPRAKSEAERQDEELMPIKMSNLPYDTSKQRGIVERSLDGIKTFFAQRYPVDKFEVGNKELMPMIENYATDKLMMGGKWNERINETYNGLSRDERRLIMTTDETGQTTLQRAYDAKAVNKLDPSTLPEAVQNYAKTHFALQREAGEMAIDEGMLRADKNGVMIPFEQAAGQRIPQLVNQETRAAIDSQSGPRWNALVDWVNKYHDIPLSRAKQSLIDDYGTEATTRRAGSLEYVRKIPSLPSVLNINGVDTAMMTTEPRALLERAADSQFGRIAWIRQMGQAVLDEVPQNKLYQISSILGTLDKATTAKFSEGLLKGGFSQDAIDQMKPKEIRTNAKNLGLSSGMSQDELVSQIMNVSPTELGVQQLQKLINVAKEVGGVAYDGVLNKVGVKSVISPTRSIEFFNDLKERITSQSDDLLADKLARFKLEGGKQSDWDTVAKLAQGLPVGYQLGSSTSAQAVKFASGVLGGLQTSLRVIPHLLQTPIQMPQLVGASEFLSGLAKAFLDPHGSDDFKNLWTGIRQTNQILESEPGYSLQTAGRNLSNMIRRGTLGDWAVNLSNNIAANGGRELAENWRSNGLPDGAEARARRLGLDDNEIEQLKSPNNNMSDITFAKIIQNTVGKTQFLADRAYNKGAIENVPLGRMLFAYSSYMMGTTRANAGLIGDIKEAVANKDQAAIFDGVKRVGAVVAGSLGMGALELMVKQAVKGQTSSKMDESYWDKSLEAINQTAMFGMMHRVADTFKYDQGSMNNALVGLIPKVSAVTELMGALLGGYGKFGEFGIGTRLEQEAIKQIPIVGAVHSWVDKLINPRLSEYEEARSVSKGFEKNTLGIKPDNSQSELKPDYYPTFSAAQRFDLEGAQSEATAYYKKAFADPANISKSPSQLVDNLRASLVAKAPLNLNQLNIATMLSSIPRDQAQKLIKTHMDYMNIVNSIAPVMAK